MSGGIRAAVLASVLLLLSCGVAAADINVNVTGWWRTGDAFNASGTPIQAAVLGANTYESLNLSAGTYTESTPDLTKVGVNLTGAGMDATILSNAWAFTANDCETHHIGETTTGVHWWGDADDITITNCKMMYMGGTSGATGLTFTDNTLWGFGVGVGGLSGSAFTNTNFSGGSSFYDGGSGSNNVFDNSNLGDDSWISVVGGAVSSNNIFKNIILGNNAFIDMYGTFGGTNNTFANISIGSKESGQAAIRIDSGTGTAFIDTTHTYPSDHLFHVSNSATGYAIQNDNRVFVGTAGFTIANTTATNLTFANGLYDYRPFWITPSTGELNITSTPTWDTSGNYKKQFNITGTSGTFTYRIGDMLPNTEAKISTDSWSDTKTANGDGEITGTYNGGWSTQNFTVLSITPPPTNLQHTTGNFWVNHTWQPGTGTDGYNISVNSVWHNSTAASYNDSYLAHAWQNITVWAWNSSMGMSLSNITQDTQIPNNAIAIADAADWIGAANQTVSVNYNSTDADSDTPTYSCSRTDMFTDFDTANGTGNWTPATKGTYYVDFGVSDGYGSTANYTMTIQVGVSGITTETKVPVSIFIMLIVLMFCLAIYVFYAKTHFSRIFTTLLATWLAFMLSQMIVSGNVVQVVSALNSADAWTHTTVAIWIPGLSYLLLFIGVIMSIFLVKFVITFGLEAIREAQREGM